MEDIAATCPISDEELMEAFIKGSEEAFEQLVARYGAKITNFIHRQVSDFATAEELAQDTFLAVYRKKHTYNAEYTFSAWFYKIAINFCRMHFRRRKRGPTMFSMEESREEGRTSLEGALADEGEGPLHALSRKEAEEKLREAISELPRKQRVVFTLSFYDGMTYEEIGQLLGCSPGTVASRKHTAVRRLASKLRRLGPGSLASGGPGEEVADWTSC